MKTRMLLAACAAVALGGSAVANAHDAGPMLPGTQAHQVGPYQVVDEVIHDVEGETTTASYTITVPYGARELGHLTLALADCSPAHRIESISPAGQVRPNGDPSTGTTGPVLKWTSNQQAGETRTYRYTVRDLFEPDEGELVLKSRSTDRGTVQRISCNRMQPQPCTLTPPAMAQSPEGTLVDVLLTCTAQGTDETDYGFGTDSEGNPTPPLLEINASAAGQEVARIVDRLYSSGAGSSTTKFKTELFIALPLDRVCVTVAGQQSCASAGP